MATMEHPHIVKFIGVAWESLSDLYCVTEFMTGGDLRSLLNTYHKDRTPQGMDANKIEIVYQVAYALTYLHSLDPVVLHRDLKSRNILLSERLDAKITDFGTSRTRSDETMTVGVGSWMWMAPEVMLGGHYDEKADVYSLGVVLAELDTHELPYSHAKRGGLSEAAMMQMLSMGKLRVRFSEFTDPTTIAFAESCVNLDPKERPTAAEVLYFFQKARNRY
ncbi:TKL protein kinase [Phytophthora megakarya]|uniref:TKL protein kinase n=1 Tax=Phytophthora megakarya TaxID=4795 RepID=A0A225V4D9_9STRA|nr:TKL protein kinase [Phytophthora megakarya]